MDGGEMKDICSECSGSKWVNTMGARTIATTEADPFRSPCPACQKPCKTCGGTDWIKVLGRTVIPTDGGDIYAMPCTDCRAEAYEERARQAYATVQRPKPPAAQAPPPAAYQPEALALLGRTVAAVEQAAAEAKPSPEEVATWEAEKAAQTARAEAHKAHMDRAEQRALKSLAIEERKAAALEQIAKEAVQIATLLENLNNMAGWPR